MIYLKNTAGTLGMLSSGPNYKNLQKSIKEKSEYLEKFFRNLLMDEQNELKNRYCRIDYKKYMEKITATEEKFTGKNPICRIGADKNDKRRPENKACSLFIDNFIKPVPLILFFLLKCNIINRSLDTFRLRTYDTQLGRNSASLFYHLSFMHRDKISLFQ